MYCHIVRAFVLLICCTIVTAHPRNLDRGAKNGIATADFELSEHGSLLVAKDNLTPTEETGTLESDHDSLSRRSYYPSLQALPVAEKCRNYLANRVLPKAMEAYEFIADEVCKKGGCRLGFDQVYRKYRNFVIDFIDDCVVRKLESGGVPGLSKEINTRKVLNEIAKDCFENDRNIMSVTNICYAREQTFERVKNCVVPKVIQYVPSVMMRTDEICQVAEATKIENDVAGAKCLVSS